MSDHTALLNRIRQVSALAPFNQWLDLQVEQAEPGLVTLRLDWRDDFAQYSGHLHAALIGGLIDTDGIQRNRALSASGGLVHLGRRFLGKVRDQSFEKTRPELGGS